MEEQQAQWDLQHHLINQSTFQDDTTLAQAQNSNDIQGISFFRSSVPRAKYKLERVEKYKLNSLRDDGTMKNILVPKDQIRSIRDECLFYQFRQNSRTAGCFLTHFQLRHLLSCTTNHDVYFLSSPTVVHHFNPTAYKTKQGTRGALSRVLDHPQNTANPIIFSTIGAYQQFVVAGGYRGELVVKNTQTQQILYDSKVTQSENAITNYIEIFESKSNQNSNGTSISNQLNVLISQNDNKVRLYDLSTNSISLKRTYDFEYAINHSSLSPNQKMFTVAGDEDDILICDFESGKTMTRLKGHLDFSFATAWKPNCDHIVATGSQDSTLRIWDLRMVRQNEASSLCCIAGILGPIRSLHYSHDGAYLAAAEPADFVRIIDTETYDREQQLDVFGEITGVAFSPQDSNYLFVGVSDRLYASVVEFSRVKFSSITDDVVL